MNNNNIPIQMNQNPVNKTCKQRKPRNHYLLKKPWRKKKKKKKERAWSLTEVSSLSLVFFLNCGNTQCEQNERHREKGIEFSFVGEQSGRERKQFWLSDPLRRPERTAEKRERERERGSLVLWLL